MKLTPVLCRANYVKWKRFQWRVYGKRVVRDDGVKAELEKKGIVVEDAVKFVEERMKGQIIPLVDASAYKYATKLPDYGDKAWHEKEAYDVNDLSVGVPGDGLVQIQRLTKTIARMGFPQELENLVGACPDAEFLEHELVKYARRSKYLDATQEKLPKEAESIEDLMGSRRGTTVGINKRREFGVPLKRRGEIMVEAMLRLSSATFSSNRPWVRDRATLRDVVMNVPFQLNNNHKIVFRLRGDRVVMSKNPVSPWADAKEVFETGVKPVPEIHPLGPLAMIKTTNVYNDADFFPLAKNAPYRQVHTVFSLFDDPNCEWDVSQKVGRLLLHSFGWAVANARFNYGESLKELPHPITVQTVHTDGREFIFGCFQLNTLNLTNSTKEGTPKNMFWYLPPLALWSQCGFKDAVPFMEGFNPQVFHNFVPLFLGGAAK